MKFNLGDKVTTIYNDRKVAQVIGLYLTGNVLVKYEDTDQEVLYTPTELREYKDDEKVEQKLSKDRQYWYSKIREYTIDCKMDWGDVLEITFQPSGRVTGRQEDIKFEPYINLYMSYRTSRLVAEIDSNIANQLGALLLEAADVMDDLEYGNVEV